MTNEQLTEKAKDSVDRLFRKAIWNSAILCLMFGGYAAGGYASGNYLLVALSALAVYFTASDAIEFYNFKKNVNITVKGENNG